MKMFPDLARQDEIKFMFLKSVPYTTRLMLIVGGMVLGLLLQLFFSFWPGFLLLAFVSGISLVEGYDSTPVASSKEEKWDQVTPDEYLKVKSRQKELARWDLDAFDFTNPLGRTVFIVLFLVSGAIWLGLLFVNETLAWYWALDMFILWAPHWFTGVKEYLRQDKLIIKINLLEKVMAAFAAPSDIQVLPMLATRTTKEGRRFPTDARLMFRLVGAPAAFLGLQVQIAINSVQGIDYPYLYCVLLARGEERLFAGARDIAASSAGFWQSGITVEPGREEGVDVLVIRQTTSQTSGYSTDPRRAVAIVGFAVEVARRLCNVAPPSGKPSRS